MWWRPWIAPPNGAATSKEDALRNDRFTLLRIAGIASCGPSKRSCLEAAFKRSEAVEMPTNFPGVPIGFAPQPTTPIGVSWPADGANVEELPRRS